MSALHMNSANKTKTWWMEGDEGTFFHSPLAIRFALPFFQLWWNRLPWRWGAVCVCVCTPLLPPLPSFFFGFLLFLAFAWLPSHDHQFAGLLYAPLFLSLEGRRRGEGQSQMAQYSCGCMSCWWRVDATVYTSQLPLRSRLTVTHSSCCVYMLPFSAV